MITDQIRAAIEAAGGLKSFPARIRRERAHGRPMKRMMNEELQELSQEELNVAWHLGLIGNAGSVAGTIIPNAKSDRSSKYAGLIGNKNAAVSEPRDKTLTIRVSKDEMASLRLQAGLRSMGVATYVRQAALRRT